METGILIVFLGIGLFLIAGLFGGLGIYYILKSRIKASVIFFIIGFALILSYIITLLSLL